MTGEWNVANGINSTLYSERETANYARFTPADGSAVTRDTTTAEIGAKFSNYTCWEKHPDSEPQCLSTRPSDSGTRPESSVASAGTTTIFTA